MDLIVSVRGDSEAAGFLDKMGDRAVHARPLFEEISDLMLDSERDRFRTGRFRKLAESTRERKSRQGLPPRPLHGETGDLMDSLTQPGHPQMKRDISGDMLIFGTRVFYARFHQKGTGGMAKRMPLQFTAKQRKPMIEAVNDWLINPKRSGRRWLF